MKNYTIFIESSDYDSPGNVLGYSLRLTVSGLELTAFLHALEVSPDILTVKVMMGPLHMRHVDLGIDVKDFKKIV